MTDSLDPDGSFQQLISARVNDPQRLAAVRASGLLDATGASFDRIASLASRLFDTPFGFITVVDDRRSFWKARVGVDGPQENLVEESFCQYVIAVDDVFTVDDARLDPRTVDNPSIDSMGIRAWAGAPLRAPTGHVLGTVCVADNEPRRWSSADAELLIDLAAVAADIARSSAVDDESRALLAAILERSPIGFALLDHELRHELINQVLADINGASISDHLGRSVAELVPGVVDAVTPIIQEVLATGVAVTNVEIRGSTPARPGVERVWHGSYYRLDVGSNQPKVGIFVEEITERAKARDRAETLARIIDELTRTATLEDVAGVVGAEFASYFGAAGVVVALMDRAADSMVPLASQEVVEALSESSWSMTDDAPYVEAFTEQRVVLTSDANDRASRYTRELPVAVEATAAVPCVSADGETIGVMVVGWSHRVEVEEFPVDQLRTVAGVVANVIDRNLLSAERVELILALEESLLNIPAVIDRVEVAVRYVPATDAIGFGGDWYDVLPVGDDRVALVVGDVVGHDAAAAARMSQIRTVIGDLLLLDTPLDEVFLRAENLLAVRGNTAMATVGLVVIDTIARSLTALSAGHLPPIIIGPDGNVRTMDVALRPPLHVAFDEAATASVGALPTPYEAGTTLVLYTDGLIETRGGDIRTDIDRFVRSVAANPGGSPATLADALLADVTDQRRGDDTALIVAALN